MYEYAQSQTSDTVHIVTDLNYRRTLCGVRTLVTWTYGDETVSGLAATCKRCKHSLRRSLEVAS